MLINIPIVMFNSPKNIYSLEQVIQDLLREGAPFEDINQVLNKLRKYSYQSYIETNLRIHKTNPKKYHAALQNLVRWNIDLDRPSLNSQCDVDPALVYETQEGEVVFNDEAREAS